MISLCHVNDINNNQSKGFSVEGHSIFIVKKYNKIFAYHNSCPHLGVQLEMVADQFLDSSHSLIMCAMHGALFRIEDGLCISGPCLDRALTSIPFEIIDQHITISQSDLH